MDYTIIRSRRKTMAIEIGRNGMVVRAPMRAGDREIRAFVEKNRGWVEKHLEKAQAQRAAEENIVPLTAEEIRVLAQAAAKVIPERVRYYAPLVGVTFGRITIRNQRTKWGSCTARGNLNFNCLLMLAPAEVLDSIVVHELCHLKVMNHSPAFYAEVLRVFPEYRKWQKWLRDNGGLLMKRNCISSASGK